jgi:hypothetical protein
MVDHQVLNLKMDKNSLPVNLPRELIKRSDGASLWKPRNPPLCDRAWTRWSRASGASGGLQIEENKGAKVTLLGTSESNGNPLTLSFPFDKSKYLSELSSCLRMLSGGLVGSFGGAIAEENRAKTVRAKRRMKCLEE